MGPDENVKQQTKLLREQVRLQRQANRRLGCLSGVVFTLLFGVWYWAWLAVKWTVRGAWRLGMASWGVIVYASMWTWHWSVVASVWTAGQLVTLARLASVRFQDGVMMPLGTALLRLWQRVKVRAHE